MKRFLSRSWHTLLFILWPFLSLASSNLGEFRLDDLTRAFVVTVAASMATLVVFRLLFGAWDLSAFLTSLELILFFSYGHTAIWLGSLESPIGRHRYLVPVFGSMFAFGVLAVVRFKSRIRSTIPVMNIAALVLVVTPCFVIADWWNRLHIEPTQPEQVVRDRSGHLPRLRSETLPDIYFILLDGYSGWDVMKDEFDYDNSAFRLFLQERGFFVADRSLANYAHTALSLGAVLNMRYVEDLGVSKDPTTYPESFRNVLLHSYIREQLESLGYTIIAVDSGWIDTQMADSDLYFSAPPRSTIRQLNRFESLLVETSGGRLFLDALTRFSIMGAGDIRDPYAAQRDIVLQSFDALGEIAAIPGPKFVFVHIISPHKPYIFGPEGEPRQPGGVFTLANTSRSDEEALARQLYRDQLIFITNKIERSLASILRDQATVPIIVLMSDHGASTGVQWEAPDHEDLVIRMHILNAYLVPEVCHPLLYPDISPVNTFRVILNCTFHADLETVPDRSYFSGFRNSLDLTRVDTLLK